MYRVSGTQCPTGERVSTRPAASQAKVTDDSGASRSAAATEEGSMGAAKAIVNGSFRPWPVRTASSSSAETGWGCDCGMATLGAGGALTTITSPITAPAARPEAILVRVPRRPNEAR